MIFFRLFIIIFISLTTPIKADLYKNLIRLVIDALEEDPLIFFPVATFLSKLPVFEPGLENIVKKCRGRNLHFSNLIEEKNEYSPNLTEEKIENSN